MAGVVLCVVGLEVISPSANMYMFQPGSHKSVYQEPELRPIFIITVTVRDDLGLASTSSPKDHYTWLLTDIPRHLI